LRTNAPRRSRSAENRKKQPPKVQQSHTIIYRQGIRSSALLELAKERVAEARLLKARGHLNGAAYIVGYAVELMLKGAIANNRFLGFWPIERIADKYRTHDLNFLLAESGLSGALRSACGSDEELDVNWSYLKSNWSTDIRYTRLKTNKAEAIIDSALNERNGVVSWLKPFCGS
jgi:hypothetical protein